MKKKTMPELRRLTPEEFRQSAKIPVAIVLDNVRSEMNVGSVLRTADAFAMERVIMCGITSTPPRQEIHKTALGAEDSVAWSYCKTALQAVTELRAEGYTIIAIEQVHGSVSLQDFEVEPGKKYALVLGNEVKGVGQDVVDAADLCLEIPQRGTKHSLNIANSAAIAMWHFFSSYKL